MVRLLITYDNRDYPIDSQNIPFTIGRLPHNDLCSEHDIVSGSHGRIIFKDGFFFYEDLNSTNGTIISLENGDRKFLKGDSASLYGKGFIHLGIGSGPRILFEVMESKSPGDMEKRVSIENGLNDLINGNFKKAFDFFEDLIRDNHKNIRDYYYAGVAAAELNNLKFAILRFEQYLMIRPDDYDALMYLGKVYERDGQLDMARMCFRKIFDSDPTNREADILLKGIAEYQSNIPISSGNKKTRDILGDDINEKIDMPPFHVTYNLSAHGRILTDLVKDLKIACQNIGQRLGYFPSDSISVVLLRPHEDLSGKANSKGITLMVDQEHIKEKPFLTILVTHEYAHYALSCMTRFSPFLPWWFQEGFAQYMSQPLTFNRLSNISVLIKHETLIPLESLERGPGGIFDSDVVNAVYLEAHSALSFLVKKIDWKGLRHLMEGLKKGFKIKEAFDHIGYEYYLFEEEWHQWLSECEVSRNVRLTREVIDRTHKK